MGTLFFNISKFVFNNDLTEETLACIKNFTKPEMSLRMIQPQSTLNKVIEFALDIEDSQRKTYAIGVLKNCSHEPNLLDHMKKLIPMDMLRK